LHGVLHFTCYPDCLRRPSLHKGGFTRNDMGQCIVCVATTCVYLSPKSTSLRGRNPGPNFRHFQARFSSRSANGERKVYVYHIIPFLGTMSTIIYLN
jgi:hypothetical protein